VIGVFEQSRLGLPEPATSPGSPLEEGPPSRRLVELDPSGRAGRAMALPRWVRERFQRLMMRPNTSSAPSPVNRWAAPGVGRGAQGFWRPPAPPAPHSALSAVTGGRRTEREVPRPVGHAAPHARTRSAAPKRRARPQSRMPNTRLGVPNRPHGIPACRRCKLSRSLRWVALLAS